MEWYWAFSIIVGGLCALMVIGMPIAFAFLAVNILGAWFFWGGIAGLNQMVLAVMDSVASFSIMPVPLFLLMGEILFRAGLAARLMDVLDAWLGRVPGRLSLMAVAGGTNAAGGTRSNSSWKWHSVCTQPEMTIDGEAIFANPENYSVHTTTTMKRSEELKTSQRTVLAHWLGADCGDLKPFDPKR